MVATSTPELKRLGEEADIRSAKQNRKESAKTSRRRLLMEKSTYKGGQRDVKSSSDEDNELKTLDSSDDNVDIDDDAGTQQPILIVSVDFDSVKVDSNVLVGFVLQKQKQGVFYVAKVLSQVHYDVEYLRKSTKVHNKFILPNVQDIASVGRSQIQAVLPKPVCKGTILH